MIMDVNLRMAEAAATKSRASASFILLDLLSGWVGVFPGIVLLMWSYSSANDAFDWCPPAIYLLLL